MAKTDNIGMLSSSIASVIRQSLNGPFRKECYLLLGVTNNRDAQEAIYTLLKSRDDKKKASTKNAPPHKGPAVGGKCVAGGDGTDHQVLTLSRPESVDNSVASRAEDKVSTTRSHPDIPLSCFSEDNPSLGMASSSQGILEPKLQLGNEEFNDALSDDETQLDWDVQPVKEKKAI